MMPDYKTMTIAIDRLIPASPAELYEAWLDPATPGTPWAAAECEKVVLDARVDGLFYFRRGRKAEGEGFPHFGRFVALYSPTTIEYTWMSPFTRGLESIVTVTLEAKGHDTLLRLRHANLPDDELGRLHDSGWTSILGALVERFASRRRTVHVS